jgi:nucleotide-binding universal stress UspA family protein
MLQKILIAIGDSLESESIFKAGLTLAEKFGAEVSLLHVLPPFQNSFEPIANPGIGGNYMMMNDSIVEQYHQELKAHEQLGIERLQLYAKTASDIGIEAEIFQNIGDAGRKICETAKDCVADLIVMGRHQKSMLNEIFLGSTSNYVLHHARCSVMVIQQA